MRMGEEDEIKLNFFSILVTTIKMALDCAI